METTASLPSDQKPTSSVSPPQSPSQAPPSPPLDHRTQEFASTFTTLYQSIFPPKSSPFRTSLSLSITPTNSSPSSSTADDIATEHRLHQARLILEYQELCDHYDLSLTRLQTLTNELESLRRENTDLRLANNELIELLSLSSQAAIHGHFGNLDTVHDCAPKRELERISDLDLNRTERRSAGGRVSLPKSISVRSSGYQKVNQNLASKCGGSSTSSAQPRFSSQLDLLISGSVQPRVFVPTSGGNREDPLTPVELEVYNQGMWKTELCNKWQETGTCPYGDHCQFAHGITELRPVIRHPRYKTQVCRMVLAGDICPYAHRCHFRHSLTEQERLFCPR